MRNTIKGLIPDPCDSKTSINPKYAVAIALCDDETRDYFIGFLSKFNLIYDCSRDYKECLPTLFRMNFFFRIIDVEIYQKVEKEVKRFYFRRKHSYKVPLVVVSEKEIRLIEHPAIINFKKLPSEMTVKAYFEAKKKIQDNQQIS